MTPEIGLGIEDVKRMWYYGVVSSTAYVFLVLKLLEAEELTIDTATFAERWSLAEGEISDDDEATSKPKVLKAANVQAAIEKIKEIGWCATEESTIIKMFE